MSYQLAFSGQGHYEFTINIADIAGFPTGTVALYVVANSMVGTYHLLT